MTTIIFAPSVHTGGGLVLLAELCRAWPSGQSCEAFLDARALDKLPVPGTWRVRPVARAFSDRLRAEHALARSSANADMVFCFHNLPPIFGCRAPVVCYVQNPVLIGLADLSGYPPWVRFRLMIERFISRRFKANADCYVVQTQSMARALRSWLTQGRQPFEPQIAIMPFTDQDALSVPADGGAHHPTWDFVYVSDGQAHKNHSRLFEAWALLARDGLRPTLAVTLHAERDRRLRAILQRHVAEHGLAISDLGQMNRAEVLPLYRRARAMLFASNAESYGIPFLEARAAGLPILAAERDFVRDICTPVETFDPLSAVSIARAVKRFLGRPEAPLDPLTPVEFVTALLNSMPARLADLHPSAGQAAHTKRVKQ